MRGRATTRPAGARWVPACTALAALVCPAVQAAIVSCTAVTASGVAFGTYNPTAATALTSTGTVTVTCNVLTGLPANTVTIDLSTGASNSYSTRTLSSGTGTLNYNLYVDSADTQIWGNGSGGSVTETLTVGSLTSVGLVMATATVYGLVPALQDPSPGSYTDTITVTVNY